MSSFSDSFPIEEILDELGDDVLLIHFGGGSEIIKGIFEYKYLPDEVGDVINIEYPTLEVATSIAKKINSKSKIKSDDVIYKIHSRRNIDKISVLIILSQS